MTVLTVVIWGYFTLLWLYKVHYMITFQMIHCVQSLKILLEQEILENIYSTMDFKLILIMLSMSGHDQYSELEMTLQDHKECLSATYNSTLFRHGHLSSLLRTGKGSDCLLHSAERSQSSYVNPQRAEGWTAVRACVWWTSETVFRITEMDMPLTVSDTLWERAKRFLVFAVTCCYISNIYTLSFSNPISRKVGTFVKCYKINNLLFVNSPKPLFN